MSLHKDLPIYKATYELMLLAMNLIKNMRRDFKTTVGQKINAECLELSTLVYRANVAIDKVPYLNKLLEHVQVAELLFRLATDLKLITLAQYAAAIAITSSIGRQANGWRGKKTASLPAT
ncbi:four helix bundle protein [Duganella sp. BJB475]|uniref:four helix bundle protein n=1 Tax=Duganella sp. BJB475 TaxID=2233914 RepID=UPI000E3490B8|nr:four helix bundle protein [Duganella sp. BJB475]RFP19133.1 four helix bundle protein [Duganella sp. BJB475]